MTATATGREYCTERRTVDNGVGTPALYGAHGVSTNRATVGNHVDTPKRTIANDGGLADGDVLDEATSGNDVTP